jgi:hypothetical protein
MFYFNDLKGLWKIIRWFAFLLFTGCSAVAVICMIVAQILPKGGQ